MGWEEGLFSSIVKDKKKTWVGLVLLYSLEKRSHSET